MDGSWCYLPENLTRLDIIWVPYFLWLAGFLCVLVLRPRDTRRSLLIACYYLTAVWVVIGISSSIPVLEKQTFDAGGHLAVSASVSAFTLGFSTGAWPPAVLNPEFLPGWFCIGNTAIISTFTNFGLLVCSVFDLARCLSLQSVHMFKYPDQRRDLSLLVIAIVLVAFLQLP